MGSLRIGVENEWGKIYEKQRVQWTMVFVWKALAVVSSNLKVPFDNFGLKERFGNIQNIAACAPHRKDDLKRYRKMCRECGFRENTPAFSQCLQDADLNDHGVILRQITDY